MDAPHDPHRGSFDPSLRVARVLPAQWESHRDLRLDMLAADPTAFWAVREDLVGLSEQQWREDVRGPRHHLQARRGTEVLGGIAVLPGGYTPDHVVPDDQAQLVSLWVRPAARGQGVAPVLVRAAAREALRLGRPDLHLEVDDAQTAAIALYERLGFRATGARDPRPATGGHWVEFAARAEDLLADPVMNRAAL